jgi:hypothetical protein
VRAEDKAGWEYVFAENKAAEEKAAAAAEQAKLSKEAVEAVSAGLARQAAEDRAFAYQQVAAWEAMDAAPPAPKEVESEWICQTCTAVWRTKTKVE